MKLCTVCGVVTSRLNGRCSVHPRRSGIGANPWGSETPIRARTVPVRSADAVPPLPRRPALVGFLVGGGHTTTMTGITEVVSLVRNSDLEGVRVIVGGTPPTDEYATSIGADGYAPDAAAAVDVVKTVLGIS